MKLDDDGQAVLDSVSLTEMWGHLEHLCTIDRTSGSSGERQAAAYLAEHLAEYGCQVRWHEFDAYLSYPVSGRVLAELGAPHSAPLPLRAKTRAFSASTGPAGATGEIVYVPGTADMFTDTATVRRLRQLDLTGKVVLSEGGGRQNMLTARRLGAVAYIHMWPSEEDVIHEGIVTPIWGTPTPGTLDTLPGIPVVSVTNGDGETLRQAAAKGPVRVTVHARADTGWHRLSFPEAVIPGATPDYVLIAGHLDSWHLGATDNATGNVSCLELARVFQARQPQLQRGIRIAWWPGHSTGRYAGSTWYCDQHWQDLHDHCVAYINVDSPGCLGATDYSTVTAVAETSQLAQETVFALTGQHPGIERPVRAGDQSFWGPGVSSMFMLLSNRPPGQRAAVGGSGLGWWWHTEQDTIDKVEAAVLLLDTQIYALGAWRLCTAAQLPLQLVPLAREIQARLAELEPLALQAGLDWQPLTAAAGLLASRAEDFDAATDRPDQCLLGAIRALTPVNYSPVAPHEHGPATPTSVLPALEDLESIGALPQDGDEARFLLTALTRRRNAVLLAVLTAARALAGDGV